MLKTEKKYKLKPSRNSPDDCVLRIPKTEDKSTSNRHRRKLRRWSKASLVEHYREYCGNTSIHGVQYLGENDRPLKEKVFWISIFVVSIYLCSELIIKTYRKWDETPVIVSFSEKSTPVWEIPFPAITICPETKSPKHEFLNFTRFYNEMQANLLQNGSVIVPDATDPEEFRNMRALLQICGSHLVNHMNFLPQEPMDYFARLDQISFSIEEICPFCKWRNKVGACEPLFSKVYTEEGICYTFNGLNTTELYREETFQFQNYKQRERLSSNPSDWSLQDGYSGHAGIDAYPHRVHGAGARPGIFIALQGFEEHMDYICRGPVQGFKVSLHSPDEVVPVANQYLRIPFKKEVLVAVRPSMIITSLALANYEPDRRQCYFNTERHLRFFKVYTQNNCELECLTNYTLHKCGCVKFSMPRLRDTPVCDESKILCYDEAEDELLKNEFAEGLIDSKLNFRGHTKCNCLPACTSLTYNTEISQADFDLESMLKAYDNTSYLEQNPGVQMSRLAIFFKENQFMTSKRSELYGMADFLANCGGLFGLFMGVSFLSVIEIFYYCSLRLWANFERVRRG